MWLWFQMCTFQTLLRDWYKVSINLKWIPEDLVNIGSGNGLVASANKPLPESSVDQDLQRHTASLGHNEVTHWLIPNLLKAQ